MAAYGLFRLYWINVSVQMTVSVRWEAAQLYIDSEIGCYVYWKRPLY